MNEHIDYQGSGWSNASRWVFWGFVLVGGFFLITEHRAHLFGILPFLFLAACPLMHLFHHHGKHGSHDEPQQDRDAGKDNTFAPGDRSQKSGQDHNH